MTDRTHLVVSVLGDTDAVDEDDLRALEELAWVDDVTVWYDEEADGG